MVDQPKSKPKSEYKRGSAASPAQEQTPYGSAKALNDASQMANLPFPEVEEDEDTEPRGKLTDADGLLFRKTDRPGEPLSTGAAYGPGPNVLKGGREESDEDFRARVTSSVINSPSLDSRTKAFLARVARGE